MFPKILIAAPQHESKNYCWDLWAERVKSLTYPNYDVFISDNSPTKDNLKIIKSKGFNAKHTPSNKKGLLHTINDSHNACRNYALTNNYEYILHLETDIIPPFDVIERLLNHKRKICSGLYDLFHGKKRKLMVQIPEDYDRSIRGYRTVGYAEERESNFFDGKIKKVYHAGIGCILIHKSVLKKFPFRVVSGIDFHSDTWFANDCYMHNIPIYVDTTLMCEHLNSTWLSVKEEVLNFKA